jgi:hypothetical protein
MMDEVFHATHLERDLAHKAYPLIRAHDPSITLRQWVAFVQHCLRVPERRGALVTVKDGRGYLHALFRYRIEIELGRGRSMLVSDLIVGHLPGKAVRSAIIEAIGRFADRADCVSITIELPHSPAGVCDVAMRNAFAGVGFTPGDVTVLQSDHRR